MQIAEAKPVNVNWLIGVTCVVALGMVLFLFDPAHSGFYPVCIFYRTTGWQCPGCGGLRAAHQLLHGHFAAAFRLNALLMVFLLPAACLFGTRWWICRSRNQPLRLHPFWLWFGLVVTVAFGIARNLF